MDTIGFIGLGKMGAPMARNIQKAGYQMVVHDIREDAAKPLLDGGARLAGSPERHNANFPARTQRCRASDGRV